MIKNDLRKQKRAQVATLVFLGLATVFMAIGFAAYAQTLRIAGTATVAGATWSVKWDQNSFVQSANSQTITKTITNTQVSFQCTLPEPGTFCAFTVNAVNNGTYDAKLNEVVLSNLTTEQQAYLSYRAEYDGQSFAPGTTDTSSLNLILPKKTGTTPGEKTAFVRVDFNEPSDYTNLPSTAQEVEFTIDFKYDQN